MATEIRIEPLKHTFRAISTLNDPALETMFIQWAARYRSFVQQRFNTYSRGGGNWPPLARSTLLARSRAAKRRAREAYGTEANPVLSRVETKHARIVAQRRRKRAAAVSKRLRKRIDAGTYKASILRDTGILFAALQPQFVGGPGQLQERIEHGIRVGIGGPHSHPDAGGKGGHVTIGDLAVFHDSGAGVLPKREIIVEPDDRTIAGMVSDVDRAIARMIAGA